MLMFSASTPGTAKAELKGNPAPELEGLRSHLAWYGSREETMEILGFVPKWLHSYHGWERNGWEQALSDRQLEGKKRSWMPMSDVISTCIMDIWPKGVDHPIGADLQGIIDGKYDDKFRQLVKFYTSIGQTKMIWRLFHEMDVRRDWFQAYATPEKFKSAWARIVKIVRSMGNNAIEFQYSINGPATSHWKHNGELVIDLFYPGDEYVDRIGGGVYNRESMKKTSDRIDKFSAFVEKHPDKIVDYAENGGWDDDDPRYPLGGGDNPDFVDLVVQRFMSIPQERRGYLMWFNRQKNVRIQNKPNQLKRLRAYL